MTHAHRGVLGRLLVSLTYLFFKQFFHSDSTVTFILCRTVSCLYGVWLCSVMPITEFDSTVSKQLRRLTPRCHTHCVVWIHSIMSTAKFLKNWNISANRNQYTYMVGWLKKINEGWKSCGLQELKRQLHDNCKSRLFRWCFNLKLTTTKRIIFFYPTWDNAKSHAINSLYDVNLTISYFLGKLLT